MMKLSHPELFNIELGQRVWNQLTDYPESHVQSQVWCRSAGCIAGHTYLLGGGNIDDMHCIVNPMVMVMAKAEEMLGLDEPQQEQGLCSRLSEEASHLFDGCISGQQAREILADYLTQARVAQPVEKIDTGRVFATVIEGALMTEEWTPKLESEEVTDGLSTWAAIALGMSIGLSVFLIVVITTLLLIGVL
jgi:hypothetical protein